MAILQQSSNTGGPITGWPLTTLAPAGQTFAVCLAVKDSMNIQRPKFEDPTVMETKNFTRFLFGLPDGTMIQTGEMTISLNEKSKLFKTLTSWNGTMPFSGFDTETMVGKGATLNIVHKTIREIGSMQILLPSCRSCKAWRDKSLIAQNLSSHRETKHRHLFRMLRFSNPLNPCKLRFRSASRSSNASNHSCNS